MTQRPLPPNVILALVALTTEEDADAIFALVFGGTMSFRAVMRSRSDSSGLSVAMSEASEISESAANSSASYQHESRVGEDTCVCEVVIVVG